MARYYECGRCGAYHLEDFQGDCRDDTQRYQLEHIDDYKDEIVFLEEQMEGGDNQ